MPISTCNFCEKEYKHHYSAAGKYCSTRCMGDDKIRKGMDDNRALFEEGKISYRPRIKKFVAERDGYSCAECGISDWRDEPIALWLDHIDGDASNNMPDNFRLMCPNCESQSDTFGARNTGKGRKSRGLPQYG